MTGNRDINNLISLLNSLGYMQYQIDSIVKEAVGTVVLTNLNKEEQTELVEVLQEYVNFAVKCRQSLK